MRRGKNRDRKMHRGICFISLLGSWAACSFTSFKVVQLQKVVSHTLQATLANIVPIASVKLCN